MIPVKKFVATLMTIAVACVLSLGSVGCSKDTKTTDKKVVEEKKTTVSPDDKKTEEKKTTEEKK
jgi:hypothetical protein